MGAPRSRARNWRAADLRGAGPEPRSVREVVQRVWLSLFAARWSESALFGVAAMLLTLAAAEFSLADVQSNGRFGVAILAALFAALAWGIEHREEPRDVARRLDRRMRHEGALFTAWELEARDESLAKSRMAVLLRRRVLAKLRTREAVRALHPPLALPLAAPLLAWGALSFAQDLRGEDARPGADLQALTEGGALVLRQAWMDSFSELQSEDERQAMRELAKVEEELRRLALRKPEGLEESQGQMGEDSGWRDELDRLDEELAQLGRRLSESKKLTEAIEQARNALDAARMGTVAGEAPRPEPAGITPAADGAASEATGAELAGGGESGTMGGEPSGVEPDPSGSSRAPSSPSSKGPGGSPEPQGTLRLPAEVAAGAGRWWDPAQDDVVEHWLELRRLALEGTR